MVHFVEKKIEKVPMKHNTILNYFIGQELSNKQGSLNMEVKLMVHCLKAVIQILIWIVKIQFYPN